MEVFLDINDAKVPFIMELLQGFSFEKAKKLTIQSQSIERCKGSRRRNEID